MLCVIVFHGQVGREECVSHEVLLCIQALDEVSHGKYFELSRIWIDEKRQVVSL